MNEEPVVGWLTEMVGGLAGVSSRLGDDGDRIDVISMLEKLKAVVAAAQYQVVSEFVVSQEAANRALGVEARAARRGVPSQVGLARKVSPAPGGVPPRAARADLANPPPRTDSSGLAGLPGV